MRLDPSSDKRPTERYLSNLLRKPTCERNDMRIGTMTASEFIRRHNSIRKAWENRGDKPPQHILNTSLKSDLFTHGNNINRMKETNGWCYKNKNQL